MSSSLINWVSLQNPRSNFAIPPYWRGSCLYQLIRDTGQALKTWTWVWYKCLAITYLLIRVIFLRWVTGNSSSHRLKSYLSRTWDGSIFWDGCLRVVTLPFKTLIWVIFPRWVVDNFLHHLLNPYPSRETGHFVRWVSHQWHHILEVSLWVEVYSLFHRSNWQSKDSNHILYGPMIFSILLWRVERITFLFTLK